ncbi:MAG: endolytic transglycosylase MltG, partial [Candidatus Binatia bacterium]
RGVVPSARALALWARWNGYDRQIQQGAYEFRDAVTPIEALETMRNGQAMVVRVTFAEGITSSDVAAALVRAGIGSAAEYEALFRDTSFVRSLGVPADSLEGYLFPDTYHFSPLEPPRKVLAAMTRRFHEVFHEGIRAEGETLGLTPHEIVTLASIVEKETGKPEERPLIAAVFHNRLRLGMPLQSDPTVIFGIADFDGNITRRHLAMPGAYNTYTFSGLPPGPIANPGEEALLASVRPAGGSYLYFVSRNDGSHEFNTTLADHNRAVSRYQRQRRAAPAG